MGPRVLRILHLAAAACWLLLIPHAHADDALFSDDSILEIELHGPVASTIRDDDDREERPFELRYANHVIPVKVRVRGKSRVDYCRFPPLRLNVPDSATGTMFSGMGKMKLVTHCRDRDSDEENVLEEFAAYRIFALLSDFSLRARLVRIKYVDTARPKVKPIERYAFLLEPEDVLAERLAGTPANSPNVIKGRLNLTQAADVFVFQYLISNTDWSLVTALEETYCCHNGELLTIHGQDYIVPYDFDQSGLVNPGYARPSPGTKQRNVRMRRYRGYCFDGLNLPAAIERATERRGDIESLIRSLPFSHERTVSGHIEYLGRFFAEAGSPAELVAKFQKQCIG